MNRPWNYLVVALMIASFVAGAGLSSTAEAKKKKSADADAVAQVTGVSLNPAAVDPSFQGFRFGMTKPELEEFVRGRVRTYYTGVIGKTMDVRNKDKLTREMNLRIETVDDDWIKFDGSQTGWNVSNIRFEFKVGLGEEALHVQEGHDHFYYFFSNGVFYKLVRVYESPRFAVVKSALEKAYGKPGFKNREGDEDRRYLPALRWHGPEMTVDVEDWTDQFKSYTVKWADTVAEQSVLKAWSGLGGGLMKLNPLIDASKEESHQKSRDPADELLGR
jgi:hypothetical protein